MSELERRLRDALHGAAEQAPPGLLQAVRRRHRRHQVRAGAGMAAVLAATVIAVPQVMSTLGPGSGHRPGPAAGRTWTLPAAHGRPSAAPGTVLDNCWNSNIGQLGRHWKSSNAVHAGPLWVLPETVSGGSLISKQGGKDALRLYVAIVVIDWPRPGAAVVVRSTSGNLRFLDSRRDSLNPGFKYTMSSGETGVTFVTCGRNRQIYPAPYTDYMGGYLVRGKRCVTATVMAAGWMNPVPIRLGDCATHQSQAGR